MYQDTIQYDHDDETTRVPILRNSDGTIMEVLECPYCSSTEVTDSHGRSSPFWCGACGESVWITP